MAEGCPIDPARRPAPALGDEVGGARFALFEMGGHTSCVPCTDLLPRSEHRAAGSRQFFPRRAALGIAAAHEGTEHWCDVHGNVVFPFPLVDAVGHFEIGVEQKKSGRGVYRNLKLVEILFERAAVDTDETD